MAEPLADWMCLAHGVFENRTGKCPHGCNTGMVRKIFLKAPGIGTAATKNIDRNIRNLSDDYGGMDFNNQNGTGAAARVDWKVEKQQREWQDAIRTGNIQTQAVPMQGGNNSIGATMGGLGVQPGNALAQMRSMLPPPKPLVVASHVPERMPE